MRQKKNICFSFSMLLTLTLSYVFLPIIIMLLGWSKILFALPATIAIIFSLILTLKKASPQKDISLSLLQLITIIIIILIIGLLCGWGGIFSQPEDWHKHNAVFRDLITKSWPVIYHNHGVTSMLTYYSGQYIIPSIIGKLVLLFQPSAAGAAFIVGEAAMYFWNVLGLFLLILHIIHLLKNCNPVLLCICFFFCGSLLVLGRLAVALIYKSELPIFDTFHHDLDPTLIKAQYTVNFSQLRWVFQQSIIAWIITCVLMSKTFSLDSYMVLGLPLMLFSTFAFLGLLPFLISDAIRTLIKKGHFKLWLQKIFSLNNILMFLSLGTFCILYYWGFMFSPNKPNLLKFSINHFTISGIILFIFFTFGIFALLLLPAIKKYIHFDKLFFFESVLILIILPFFKLGAYNDFTMRVSIPSLFILCIAFLKALLNRQIQKKRFYWAVLLSTFLIGIYYPATEMLVTIQMTCINGFCKPTDDYKSLEYYANPSWDTYDKERLSNFSDIPIVMASNYYTYEDDMYFFIHTIGKNAAE